MELKDLKIYELSREISRDAWIIHSGLSWQNKKLIDDQFIRAIDSIGANIAEGWGRFHFLDRNRFNYNARGSLTESRHWIELMIERNILPKEKGDALRFKIETLHIKLNRFIDSIKENTK